MCKSLILRGKAILLIVALLSVSMFGSINASASTANTGMRDISSLELVKDMRVGWNLGNTLDAIGGETNWGNPKTTKAMIDKVKEMGFNTVRIPVTYAGHLGAAPNYTIDAAWLNRVEEVINYALQNDMYVITNTHHEGTWLKPTYANEAKVKEQLVKIWEQVATRFKDYSDYLVFETMNEPRVEGSSSEWSGGTAENRAVINNLNLAAVNTIRSTGGNNKTRHIMIPTHAASQITAAINDLVIPNNDSRIIVSIHNYSPYNFALNENGTAYWGSEADKSSLIAEFNDLYNKFIKNGRAVVIGECGSLNKDNEAVRIAHAEFFAKEAKAKGLTPVWWDNGYGAKNGFALLNRTNLTWYFPEVAKAFIRGVGPASTPVPTPTKTSTPTPTPTPTIIPDVLYGDVDDSGDVNSLDFAYMRKVLLGQSSEFPSSKGFVTADLNGDGSFNSLDFGYIRMYLLGIINVFPANQK